MCEANKPALNITFDSNAWEPLLSPEAQQRYQHEKLEIIFNSLRERKVFGYICDAAFKLEAIKKNARASYIASLKPSFAFKPPEPHPRIYPLFSIGPDESAHPGLPAQQVAKLDAALKCGFKLIRGLSWLSLPMPSQIIQSNYAPFERLNEELQHLAFSEIQKKGIGKAKFDELILRVEMRTQKILPGWEALNYLLDDGEQRELSLACAEWSDSELVASHIGYRNDFLCTEDRGRAAKQSVFNSYHRDWLKKTYQTQIVSISELAAMISSLN